jgi:hypothetical protein
VFLIVFAIASRWMETNIANMLDQHKQTDVESALSVLESEDGARITMNKVY